MKRSLAALSLVLSFSAQAGLGAGFNFGFSLKRYSFTAPVEGGQALQVSYTLTPLPVSFSASELRMTEAQRCAEWESPGTSPDDPGVCGRYERDGWLLSLANGEREMYALTRVVVNPATGERTVTELPRLKAHFAVASGDRRLSRDEIPGHVNLVGRLSYLPFGCALHPVLEARMGGKKVEVALCERFDQQVQAVLDGGEVRTTNGALSAEVGVLGTIKGVDDEGQTTYRSLWGTQARTGLSFGEIREQ